MKNISRPVLARYAALLGQDSIAAHALTMFDAIRSTGNRAQIKQTNEAFEVWRHGVREFPLPARREFRALPSYTLQQLPGLDIWQVAKNGEAHFMSGESNCRDWLNKWARNEFTTLPRATDCRNYDWTNG